MIQKRILLVVVALASLCACTDQGGPLPPLPAEALEIGADLFFELFDGESGDAIIQYTLYVKNVSEETLETVILKDFQLPSDVVMEKDRFEIRNLSPGEEQPVTFEVIVICWGCNPLDQEWRVDFTIRIEKGSLYTEQDVFYYKIPRIPE